MTQSIITDNIKKISELCFQNHVNKLYAFGSVCTQHFNNQSDIDLIVNFNEGLDPLVQGEAWWSLFYELKGLLKRDVDILVEQSLKNPYLLKEINKTKELVYG